MSNACSASCARGSVLATMVLRFVRERWSLGRIQFSTLSTVKTAAIIDILSGALGLTER